MVEAMDELQSWLIEDPLVLTAALDLHDFLQRTGHIELSPEERLCQLASCLEVDALGIDGSLDGWHALRRIYDRAAEFAPQSDVVQRSKALASTLFDFIDDRVIRHRILGEGERAARRAIELAPERYSHHTALGLVLYGVRRPVEALEAFRAAVALGDAAWGRLYLAHCLHDARRWDDALEAYGAVHRSAFIGPDAWRVDVLKEQRAECLLHSGDQPGARSEVSSIIERYEREPKLAIMGVSVSLWRLVQEHFSEFSERLETLEERALQMALR